jgi:ribosome-associated toxin RatA of RatAB toxin-antitoxin module
MVTTATTTNTTPTPTTTTSAAMEWSRSDQLAAPVELVWKLTTDVDRWPEILPTVRAVTRLDPDPISAGSRVRIEQPGLTAEWTVQVLESGRRFIWATEWRGRPLVAEHHLAAAGESTVNTLRLRLGGARNPLLGVTLGPLMRMTLAREARAFRRAAERIGS